MEDNFYNDDGFEEFLRAQVKDHRLYPSDSIWRNINKQLHGDTNWPALTIAAFTLLGIIVAFSIHFSPSPDIFANYPVNKTTALTGEKKSHDPKHQHSLLSLPKTNHFGKEPIPYVLNAEENSEEKESSLTTSAGQNPNNLLPQPGSEVFEAGQQVNIDYSSITTVKQGGTTIAPRENKRIVAAPLPLTVLQSPGTDITYEDRATAEVEDGKDKAGEKGSEINQVPKSLQDDPAISGLSNAQAAMPRLKKHRDSKFSYLVYITPSKSYRRLQQNTSINKGGGPMGVNYFVDVNKIARYNPGMGVEAGINFIYGITDKLKVSSGLQFNIRQYSLEAYVAPGDISTIALVNRSGNPTDTISSYAVYRTTNGYLATELVNRYSEVSLPLGLQWEVIGNRTIQLNVAASVQPTYLLNRNAYLISTDFKNYTVNPGLMHKWNINTSLEAYITIKNGDFKWQFGPQFRYQNLPTFISTYPIHENLIDYGFKIGVSKNLK